MEFKTFIAGKDDNDRRLDRVIRKFIPQDSLSGIYKAIRKGLIKVNDKKIDSSTRIFEGDSIKVASFLISENKDSASEVKALPFQIVHQTDDILIINKPYDQTVHGSADSIDKVVASWFRSSSIKELSLSFTPGPLHRLDRKTTGLLCFSLSLKGARWFSENIASHVIQKKYLGIVQGKFSAKEDWIDYINSEYDDEKAFQTVEINSSKEKSRQAVTHVTPVSWGLIDGKECSVVQFDIETGRTHQIRAQSSYHGFPLAGDTAYKGSRLVSSCDFYLHAFSLSFPKDNPLALPEKIECPLPEDFKNLTKSFHKL